MMNFLIQNSSLIQKPPDYVSRNAKTIIVLGPPRSGTSMIAGTLKLMGVFMGSGMANNHEDKKFLKTRSVPEIKTSIMNRNRKYKLWGWKMPEALSYIPDVISDVRNPHFILSFRNPLNTAFSKHKHVGEERYDAFIKAACRYYLNCMKFFEENNFPVLFLGYEHSLSSRDEYIDALAKYLDIEVSQEQRECIYSFTEPGEYRTISEETISELKLLYK